MKSLMLSLFLVFFLALPAQADHAGEIIGKYDSTANNCGEYHHYGEHPSVFMVGDSITVGGKADLLDLKPNWEINALGGRTVDCLTPLVEQRLSDGYLGKLVIALGTNALEEWGEDDYREVVDMVHAKNPKTSVIFVTTYRDRDKFNEDNGYKFRALASTQYWYTKYMYNIRDTTHDVCLAKWREHVMFHEGLLKDGVHPTDKGRKVWAGIVSNAVGNCPYG